MRLHTLSFTGLLCTVGCKAHFDDVIDAGVVSADADPDALPAVPRWSTTIGVATESASIDTVIEDASGDLWLIGNAEAFGPSYTDPWIARLDGVDGTLEIGGVHRFDSAGGENSIFAAALTDQRMFVVGSAHNVPEAERPALGEFSLDGTWASTQVLAGTLAHVGEYERLADFTVMPDGGVVAVGKTRIGTGGCTGCQQQTDGLVIKTTSAGLIEWAYTMGDALGDEDLHHVALLADGDFIIAGRTINFDHSGGAGTDIDAGYATIARISPTGVVRWAREVRSAVGSRGTLFEVVRLVGTELLVAGGFEFGTVPFLGRMSLDGAVLSLHEVDVGLTAFGRVSAIEIADNGDLLISGFESAVNEVGPRTAFVARIDPTATSVLWRQTFATSYAGMIAVGLIRSRRGDLVMWVNGSGAGGYRTQVTRVGLDGKVADCFATTDVEVTLSPLVDLSIAVTRTLAPVTGGTLVATPPVSQPLPTSPSPTDVCSP